MIYVISRQGKPLMPTKRQRMVRKLLESEQAQIVRKTPFTIKLLYDPETEVVQEVKASIVPSSKAIGVAASTSKNCLYSSETEVRQDISKKMKRRAAYRRARRNRKTRYRPARFDNRKSDRKLTPTVTSKLQSHSREIKRVEAILPVTSWTIVRASVNTAFKGHKDLEWLNLQRQTFERDNFKCQICKGKSKDFEKHCHHIKFRAEGGENTLENLVTLCKTCHVKLHQGKLQLKSTKLKHRRKLDTELAIFRKYLTVKTTSFKTYGFEVKHNLKKLKLPYSPVNLACAILTCFPASSYYIKNVSKGDYQQRKGIRSHVKIPTGKIMGFKKFDKIKSGNLVCFIKGRMSTGYAVGMDILGNSLKGNLLKLKEVKLIERRKSYLITEMGAGNTCYSLI